MRGVLVVLLLALPGVAAPVPKLKAKSTEMKLLGKWRMVNSESDIGKGGLKLYQFYVIFKEKGELELRYEYDVDKSPQSYFGTYKVPDGDRIDYTVTIGDRTKTEVLNITSLTDTEVTWVDPDKLKESLERMKDDK